MLKCFQLGLILSNIIIFFYLSPYRCQTWFPFFYKLAQFINKMILKLYLIFILSLFAFTIIFYRTCLHWINNCRRIHSLLRLWIIFISRIPAIYFFIIWFLIGCWKFILVYRFWCCILFTMISFQSWLVYVHFITYAFIYYNYIGFNNCLAILYSNKLDYLIKISKMRKK